MHRWLVEEGLRRLGEDHRRALEQTYLADRPYDEVAAELGIPAEHPAQPGVLRAEGLARRDGGDGGVVVNNADEHHELRMSLGAYVLGPAARPPRRHALRRTSTAAPSAPPSSPS